MQVMLFDLDGILLEPRGYHQALRDSVGMVGKALGFREIILTQDDIELFESVGVTSEWDSTAICAALLLQGTWGMFPERELPSAPPLPQTPMHELPKPQFRNFFRSLESSLAADTSPVVAAERSLLKDGFAYTEAQTIGLETILRKAHGPHGSLTHRLFQELVLGSRGFENTYDLEAYLDAAGYLTTLDQPMLTSDLRQQLLAWLKQPGHHAAVFTNRPSRPSLRIQDAPEAEMGLAAVDLKELPLVARGGLSWLAESRGLPSDTFLKPSEVHALAAVLHAAGHPLEAALQAAAALALDGIRDPVWEKFAGAEIYAFEDSAVGLRSVRSAQASLTRIGIAVELVLIAVTQSSRKKTSLEAAGGDVFPDMSEALHAVCLI
jgi:phosphoglycolate phosphatase-like HAD superfamily hydrolase